MTTRTCTACNETKYLTSFYRHPTGLNGRESRCKSCRRAEIYATRELKRDVYREQQRKRYATDPEYRERKRASHRAWVKTAEGRESRRITQRAYRAFKRAVATNGTEERT